MNNTRKLSLILCILSVTLVLTVMTLGVVLVSGTQYVVTDLDIHYAGSKTIDFSIGSECINLDNFQEITITGKSYTIESLERPLIVDKCFEGWYTDENLTNKVDFPFTTNKKTTLYASFLDASEGLQYSMASDNAHSDGCYVGNASADPYTTDTSYTYAGTDTEVVIPDIITYNSVTRPVKYIANLAFYQCSNITNIKMPESIKEIGAYAFYQCSSLTTIDIPAETTSVGDYGFYKCSSAQTINFNNKLQSIAGYAFGYCTSLQQLLFPASLTGGIGNRAFYECTNLESLTFQEGLGSIGDLSFAYCSKITSIVVPDSVTLIKAAFYSCTALKSVVIGSGVTKIYAIAFKNTNLTSAKFNDSSGWQYATKASSSSGKTLNISDTDFSANATLLSITYVDKYWIKG